MFKINDRKGQLTPFMILGLIILIIIILLVFLSQTDLIDTAKGIVIKSVAVPEQAKSFTFYVEGCIKEIAEEGLDLMGMHGGYVFVPNNLRSNPYRSLRFDEFTSIPYWVGESGEDIPTREFMEEQLKGYIEASFDERCEFDDFLERGYRVDYEEIRVSVKINDDSVRVGLDSGLDINVRDSRFDI